jgi:hypothetical protein
MLAGVFESRKQAEKSPVQRLKGKTLEPVPTLALCISI